MGENLVYSLPDPATQTTGGKRLFITDDNSDRPDSVSLIIVKCCAVHVAIHSCGKVHSACDHDAVKHYESCAGYDLSSRGGDVTLTLR